jgi:predicted nucleic acid-binding protein
MIEYQAVLTRQDHVAASRLSVDDVSALLDAVALVAEPVRLAFLWRPLLRDPNDDMVLEAAVNGEADALVSFNQRDFASAVARFGLPLWTPREALSRLEHES